MKTKQHKTTKEFGYKLMNRGSFLLPLNKSQEQFSIAMVKPIPILAWCYLKPYRHWNQGSGGSMTTTGTRLKQEDASQQVMGSNPGVNEGFFSLSLCYLYLQWNLFIILVWGVSTVIIVVHINAANILPILLMSFESIFYAKNLLYYISEVWSSYVVNQFSS